MTGLARICAALALGLVMFVATKPAQAQMASLVADRIQVIGNSGLLAEGNVVAIFNNVRLSATRITYDQVSGVLNITGPITLRNEDGTIILADTAQLSSDLRNGLMQSARVVLDQQLQIAAAEINRVNGRYTQMSKVVASSCQVCTDRPVPLWAIRASRVIHDQEERQLYFHNAQLRFMDIPVFYLPRLRLPDPTVTRATGFLVPRIRSNSNFGTALYLPYFITLGDHADLLIAPFISTQTATLEARFRQAFTSGEIIFEGAVTQDQILPGSTRFYLFGEGDFELPRDFKLSFSLQQISDIAYLSDYGFNSHDRLRNEVAVTRTRRNQYIYAELGSWETLRDSEIAIADQLPLAQSDFLIEQRIHPGLVGGEALLRFSGHAHVRQSDLDVLGRDLARTGVGLNWQRDWVLGSGLIASAETDLAADYYQINQDTGFATEQIRATQAVALNLAWPMSRQLANGASDVIEPVVGLVWSGQTGPDAPNEDSAMVEFDMANLFDLSRFPGADAVETGLRANIGLSWTRVNPEGLSFTLAGGKVVRLADAGEFSAASGLDGFSSDWLIGGQVQLGERIFAQGRALIADDFSVTKTESQATWRGDKLSLAGGHVWVMADAAEDRPDPIHELTLDTSYQFNSSWAGSFNSHYDMEGGTATKATLGLEYRNECIVVDLSLSRNFTSSGIVTPTTDIGFGVELTGFGGGSGAGGRSRQCSG
ncbi:MAG: LPS-assembly protein LptD [Rhodobacteraceae bacterium]|nr:LPS-assembly protein LptD [Paracoccaceae bacterium]